MATQSKKLTITTTELKRCDLLILAGRIDGSVAGQVEEALKAITDAGRYRIVLEMSGVDFTASAFLRVLIKYLKLCRRWNRGDVRLAALQPRIAEVFDLAGLTGSKQPLFKVYDDDALAVGSF